MELPRPPGARGTPSTSSYRTADLLHEARTFERSGCVTEAMQYYMAAVDAARGAGLGESHHVATFEDTVALLLKRLAPGDALLVKGSRGMRMERVVDALVARLARPEGR